MFNKTQLVLVTMYAVMIMVAWIYVLGWWTIPVWTAAAVSTWIWAKYDSRVVFDVVRATVTQSMILLGFASFVNPIGALILTIVNLTCGVVVSRWIKRVAV